MAVGILAKVALTVFGFAASGCETVQEIKDSRVGQAVGGLGVAIGHTTRDAAKAGDKKIAGWIGNKPEPDPAVKKSQIALNKSHCGNGEVDGFIGPNFKAAVAELKEANLDMKYSAVPTPSEIGMSNPCDPAP